MKCIRSLRSLQSVAFVPFRLLGSCRSLERGRQFEPQPCGYCRAIRVLDKEREDLERVEKDRREYLRKSLTTEPDPYLRVVAVFLPGE